MAVGIEINTSSTVCRRCGTAYSRLKGYFPVSYSYLYKGTGYMPYCRECVDNMFNDYLAVCHDEKMAARQMCRKLDIYWNDSLFELVKKTSPTRSTMTSYIQKVNGAKIVGKCYDDTLKEEGVLWVWPGDYSAAGVKSNDAADDAIYQKNEDPEDKQEVDEDEIIETPPEVIAFWGPGYTNKMYDELEQRIQYYRAMPGVPNASDSDMNTDMLLRQIVMMEIDINRARAEGKAVDKMATSLSSLLAQLQKPKKEEISSSVANTPFGVWIKRWENEEPVPEIDEEMKDVDHIVKYVTVWFLGHLCHMLKIRNSYCRMYEQEIARLRVERPEYDEDDDETFFNDIFGDGDTGGSD